jgi:hypothetical protein
MTMQLLELADLPAGLVLGGEIVALNEEGLPHFRSSASGCCAAATRCRSFS